MNLAHWRKMAPIRYMTLSGLLRLLALVGLAVFMAKPFLTGWTRSATDFPNYYTAAVLVRHGESLHNYYDWTWFERQLNYAGFERQLGAYTPQTPLTMLPMIAFAGQPPQVAKRIWLAINLVLLVASICILARVTRFRWEQIALLALCGFGSLSSNFIYGQYYVFLLFLMTVTFYCLHRDQTTAGGLLSGVAFGLKLYTGPFILYFAAKRKWRSVAGMAAASLGMAVLAVALFGWADVHYYVTQVLPRTLEGGSVDPAGPHGGWTERLAVTDVEPRNGRQAVRCGARGSGRR